MAADSRCRRARARHLELAEWLVERGASINVNVIGEMSLLTRLMLKGGHAPESIAQLAFGGLRQKTRRRRASTQKKKAMADVASRAPARSVREDLYDSIN